MKETHERYIGLNDDTVWYKKRKTQQAIMNLIDNYMEEENLQKETDENHLIHDEIGAFLNRVFCVKRGRNSLFPDGFEVTHESRMIMINKCNHALDLLGITKKENTKLTPLERNYEGWK